MNENPTEVDIPAATEERLPYERTLEPPAFPAVPAGEDRYFHEAAVDNTQEGTRQVSARTVVSTRVPVSHKDLYALILAVIWCAVTTTTTLSWIFSTAAMDRSATLMVLAEGIALGVIGTGAWILARKVLSVLEG